MLDEAALASVFSTLGEDGLCRLVSAFYRQVPEDDLLSPMYPPQTLAEAERRLRDFLVFRFGGPDRYIQERGHPRLRMRHAPFLINQAARDRWMKLMNQALIETEVPEQLIAILHSFLDQSATMLINADLR